MLASKLTPGFYTFSTARSSGRASNATARSLASAWSSNFLPWQCRRMVHQHVTRSCPNHLAATVPSVYLHTTDQELVQSPQSRDYTQLVHSTCWQSLITPRSRPPLLLKWFLLSVGVYFELSFLGCGFLIHLSNRSDSPGFRAPWKKIR